MLNIRELSQHMKKMNGIKFFGFMAFVISMFSGCQQSTNNTVTPEILLQPIEMFQEEYPLVCDTRLPSIPMCLQMLDLGLTDDTSYQFKQLEFEACKTDVKSFITAVNFQTKCFQTDLEDFVNEMIFAAQARLDCEYEIIQKIQNGDGGGVCPAFEVPSKSDILDMDDREYVSGADNTYYLPISCRYVEEWYSAEDRQDCISELEALIGYEAQVYYDEQIEQYLEGSNSYPYPKGVKRYVKNVISLLECKAAGISFCITN